MNIAEIPASGGEVMVRSSKLGLRVVALSIGILASLSDAMALSESDILGRWCGDNSNLNLTNYLISRTELITTHRRNNREVHFIVHSIEAGAKVITINFSKPGEAVHWVQFSNFRSNRRTMEQLPNEEGPRYVFHRC